MAGLRVLDLCAAPGGKTAQLGNRLQHRQAFWGQNIAGKIHKSAFCSNYLNDAVNYGALALSSDLLKLGSCNWEVPTC